MVYNVAVNPVGDFNQHYHRAPLAMKNTSSARVRFYVSNGGGRSSLVDTAVVAVQSQKRATKCRPPANRSSQHASIIDPFSVFEYLLRASRVSRFPVGLADISLHRVFWRLRYLT